MANYRSKIQITVDMLNEANKGPIGRTHLMYKTNTSHKMLKSYLEKLTNSGLLELNGNCMYETTGKGQEFLLKAKNAIKLKNKVAKATDERNNALEELKKYGFN